MRCLAIAWTAAAAFWVAPAGAQSPGDSIWDHNGSLVTLRAEGQGRVIVYLEPKPALIGAGVRPGTVLFRGRREGDRVQGTAYTFRQGCPPASYPVAGSAAEPGRLELTGAAPVWAGRSCDLVGATTDSPHARLVFRYLRRVGDPVPDPDPAPSPAPRQGGGEKNRPGDF